METWKYGNMERINNFLDISITFYNDLSNQSDIHGLHSRFSILVDTISILHQIRRTLLRT